MSWRGRRKSSWRRRRTSSRRYVEKNPYEGRDRPSLVKELEKLEAHLAKFERKKANTEKQIAKAQELRSKASALLDDPKNQKYVLGVFKTGPQAEILKKAQELRAEAEKIERSWQKSGDEAFDSILGFRLIDEIEFEIVDKRKSIRQVRSAIAAIDKAERAVARERRAAEKAQIEKEKIERQKALAQAHLKNVRAVAANLRLQLARSHSCPYCFGPLGDSPQADHIHPVVKGGLSTQRNMVFVCVPCNSKKKELTLNQFIDAFSLNRDKVLSALRVLGKDY
jgi:5-methylcytosine-specific restriction endonuclease McrA